MIDLRSDTVTTPSPEMRRAIAEAIVGDDVFEDDPTVQRLEQKTAEILGKEKALFVPSGTMANQISLRTLCQPGDEVICERGSHIVNYEVAGAAALSGIMLSPYDGQMGKIDVRQIENAIRPPNIHHPITKLVALENTHNRAGGLVLDLEYIGEVENIARSHSLSFYLDGARLWNAAVALNVTPKAIADHFDMVSVCFSKGLGAPVGSAISGSAESVIKARRIRKMLGGGMRQVGIIAAAALYALENNYGRLDKDHANAKRLADGLQSIDDISIDLNNVQTNIVVFEISMPVDRFLEKAAEKGLLVVPFGNNRVRAVPNLCTDDDDIPRAIDIISEVVSGN
ncbi:MAG: aminotransferase class I/II-fold pyridoxal phosphate-dependent enzyme [candidate division Zixibacteria bacterium]|nr:aminotransferase class I/II-fold pyridoxal phosphate-dependent enzyme [candidate division Zixibacteria bacterium]